jgi:hypothetical protein
MGEKFNNSSFFPDTSLLNALIHGKIASFSA